MKTFTIINIVLVIVFVAYAITRSQAFIIGPEIKVTAPIEGETYERVFEVKGIVKNARFLSINDRQIHPDKEGNFSDKVSSYSGYTEIKFFARDRRGRTDEKIIPIFIQE